MTTIHTFKSAKPETDATWFSTFLAVDRGVPSRIERDGAAFVVVADDNRAVRFEPRKS